MTAVVVVIAPVEGVSAIPLGHVPSCASVLLPEDPSVAGTPLTVSLAATLAMGLPAMPAVAPPLSEVATIAGVTTLIVSVAVVHRAGTFLSQSWYCTLYWPACTVMVVLICPDEGVSVIPVGQLPTCAMMALPEDPSMTDVPLIESLAVTLAIGREAIPASALPLSGLATTAALMTLMLSVAELQTAGTF